MRIFLAGQCHAWYMVSNRKLARAQFDGALPTERLLTSMMAGHPYRLSSYLYAKGLPDPAGALRGLANGDCEKLVIDSGLYSFMFGSEQGKLPSTYDAYRDYTRKYLDDIADWGLDNCTVVEADTHRLLGMEATFRLREEFKPLGSRVMYVWHQPEGLDGLVKLAKEVDYLGIGLPELRLIASSSATSRAGGRGSQIIDSMCTDLLRRVREACGDSPPRIHLLGCTVDRLMETQLAWSCDSTSWLAGVRFGMGKIWTATGGLEGAGLRSEKFAKFREHAMDAFPAAVDFANKTSNPEYYLNCLACAHAYGLYQVWLDSRYSPTPMRGAALPGGPM